MFNRCRQGAALNQMRLLRLSEGLGEETRGRGKGEENKETGVDRVIAFVSYNNARLKYNKNQKVLYCVKI